MTALYDSNQKLLVKKKETIKPKETFISSKFRNFEAAHLISSSKFRNFEAAHSISIRKQILKQSLKIPVTNWDIGFGLTRTGSLPLRNFAMKMRALLACQLVLTKVKSSLMQCVILVCLKAVKPYCILIRVGREEMNL